jgi:Na+-translocating ferredoxin:NAD+ oxidoreductase RNF subunit RnfB
MSIFLSSALTCGLIGLFAGFLICLISLKFAMEENPMVEEIINLLPGANCGACGLAGCANFASEIASSKNGDLYCPVGGSAVADKISQIIGVSIKARSVAVVVRCNGTRDNTNLVANYGGTKSCSLANVIFAGSSGCPYGCLKYGDCVNSCKFGALTIVDGDVPRVDESKCVACGLCIKGCPRGLLEFRRKGPKVYVACSNHEKGPDARKNCKVACIGCGKCMRAASSELVVIDRYLSYIKDIDSVSASTLIEGCPTKAIRGV